MNWKTKITTIRGIIRMILRWDSGMFGVADVGVFDPPYTHQGDQVRGYGYLHDGGIDTVFRFTSSSVFSISSTAATRLPSLLLIRR